MIKAFGGGAVGLLGDEGRGGWGNEFRPITSHLHWMQRLPVWVHVSTYIPLYTYTILCYVYVLCMKKRKKHLCQNHKTIT